jgi:hypothetical protein
MSLFFSLSRCILFLSLGSVEALDIGMTNRQYDSAETHRFNILQPPNRKSPCQNEPKPSAKDSCDACIGPSSNLYPTTPRAKWTSPNCAVISRVILKPHSSPIKTQSSRLNGKKIYPIQRSNNANGSSTDRGLSPQLYSPSSSSKP